MAFTESRCTKYGAMISAQSYQLSGYDAFVSMSLSEQKDGDVGKSLHMSNKTNPLWIYLYSFTELKALPDDAKIRSIKVNVRGGSVGTNTAYRDATSCKIMFITDFATSGTTSRHTPVSEERTAFSGYDLYSYNHLHIVEYNASSSLVSWANNNIDVLKTDNFGIRIYSVFAGITGLYLEVELMDGSVLFVGESPITKAYLGNTPLTGIYLGEQKLL